MALTMGEKNWVFYRGILEYTSVRSQDADRHRGVDPVTSESWKEWL